MNAVSSSALKGVFLQDGLQIRTPDSEDRHWTAGFVRCSQLFAVRCMAKCRTLVRSARSRTCLRCDICEGVTRNLTPCRLTFLRRHTRLEILRPREEAANSRRERGAPLAANPAREGDARAASAVRQHFVQHAPRVEEDEPTADGQDLHTLAAARAHLVLVGRVEVEHLRCEFKISA